MSGQKLPNIHLGEVLLGTSKTPNSVIPAYAGMTMPIVQADSGFSYSERRYHLMGKTRL